jgi:hypothetical protein
MRRLRLALLTTTALCSSLFTAEAGAQGGWWSEPLQGVSDRRARRWHPPPGQSPEQPPQAPAVPPQGGKAAAPESPDLHDAASDAADGGVAGAADASSRSVPGGAAENWDVLPLARERSSWWDWWAFHEEEFLFLAARARDRSASDRASECLRGDAGNAFVGVTDQQRVERALPSLLAFATATNDAATRAAALEALSRLPEDANGLVLAALLSGLAAKDARSVEAAVLGLARTAPADRVHEVLRALASDAAQGRALMQRTEVPTRLRSLAMQGLVTQAARSRDVELRRSALHVLKHALDAADASPPDLAIAVVNGIGILSSEQVVLTSQGAEWLLAALDRESRASVRPHYVIALGQLGRRLADDELRDHAFAAVLAEASRGAMGAQRAAALALGRMSRSDDALAPAVRAELLRLMRASPDPICRRFAALSLARLAIADPAAERAAGSPIVRALLGGLRSGGGEELAWHALALGVMANHSVFDGGGLAPYVRTELVQAFLRTRSPEPAAACALALGLSGHRDVAERIRMRMELTASPALLRAGAPALGLLGDGSQIPYLRALVADSTHDAETMRAAAIGLTMLGDFAVVPQLLRALQECEGSSSMERSLRVCEVLGAIGDGRAVEPLLELLAASDTQPAVRVALLRALGKLCSGAQPAWDSPRQDGAEYFPLSEAWLGDDDDVGANVVH